MADCIGNDKEEVVYSYTYSAQKHAEIKQNTLKQLVNQVRNQDENSKIS